MKIKDLFKKSSSYACAVQTSERKNSFCDIDRFISPLPPEHRLLMGVRNSVPIIDAAILKLVRLIGSFKVVCDNETAQRELEQFLQNVQVGPVSKGIDAFISCYLDQLFTFGTAVGEIVPDRTMSEICALYNAPMDCLEIECGENSVSTEVYRTENGERIKAPRQDLITVTALNPMPGMPVGTSLIKGLPFVSSVLMKIYDCIGTNFDRLGNLRFAVTCKPSSDGGDRAFARERAIQIAEQWSNAMQSGQVKDFVAVGDVQIKVIGADNQMIDTEVPVRQMLEQIIAKTGIPPFMFGLSWSTTERMAEKQLDVLTSELEYYRSLVNPVITKICSIWLRMHGYGCNFDVEWNDITMQDEVDIARIRLINAQAAEIEQTLENGGMDQNGQQR